MEAALKTMGKLRHRQQTQCGEPDYDLGTLALDLHYSKLQSQEWKTCRPDWGISLETPQCPCIFHSVEYRFLGEEK